MTVKTCYEREPFDSRGVCRRPRVELEGAGTGLAAAQGAAPGAAMVAKLPLSIAPGAHWSAERGAGTWLHFPLTFHSSGQTCLSRQVRRVPYIHAHPLGAPRASYPARAEEYHRHRASLRPTKEHQLVRREHQLVRLEHQLVLMVVVRTRVLARELHLRCLRVRHVGRASTLPPPHHHHG